MDKRQHSRIGVENQCKARFQLGGQQYNNITVRNLGADGCCIQVPAKSVSGLQEQTSLDGWELVHPSLPKGSIKARVVWCHGREPKAEYIETGVQFLDAPAGYTRDLDKYVTTLARSNPSGYM
jgi:c-di-GMP-binding flagellar brake protein YcgR